MKRVAIAFAACMLVSIVCLAGLPKEAKKEIEARFKPTKFSDWSGKTTEAGTVLVISKDGIPAGVDGGSTYTRTSRFSSKTGDRDLTPKFVRVDIKNGKIDYSEGHHSVFRKGEQVLIKYLLFRDNKIEF